MLVQPCICLVIIRDYRLHIPEPTLINLAQYRSHSNAACPMVDRRHNLIQVRNLGSREHENTSRIVLSLLLR
jgi:hypothetical protein